VVVVVVVVSTAEANRRGLCIYTVQGVGGDYLPTYLSWRPVLSVDKCEPVTDSLCVVVIKKRIY